MKRNSARNLRFALVAVLTAALFLSVAAFAAVPSKGKPGKPEKGKETQTAAHHQYGPSGHQYGPKDPHGKKKVTLCHKGKTITVGAPASRAHLRHGDKLGHC